MLTETEARDLLARAAATIEVRPGAPLARSTSWRRRWLVPVAAAAAVVLLIVGGAVLMRDEEPSGIAPAGPAAPGGDAAASGIPSVFGYDADSAQAMLSEQGLVVTRKPSYTCLTSGRAVRTKPDTGTRFDPGDALTLFVTAPPPAAECVVPAKDALAWQLLDFANGRGPAPVFAAEVTVYVNGLRTTLTGIEAAEPDSWSPESALGLLATATRQEHRGQGVANTPYLTVHTGDGTLSTCDGRGIPDDLAGRQSLWLSIAIPIDGVFGACTFANLFQSNGQIDAIVVRASPLIEDTDPEPEPDPDPDGIGAAFLAYARGEAGGLPVDTPVRLYLGNEYQKTISAQDVGDLSSWDVCAVYAEISCPMSAVTTLSRFEHRPAVTDFLPDACLNTLADEPVDTGGPHMVVLGVPELQSCAQDFAVQIWSNDVGQITAVNLLFGSP